MKKKVSEFFIHITKDHSGKMEGMQSISTSCKCNPNCERYSHIDGCICQWCYADAMLSYRKNMNPCLERNTQVLTTSIIPMEHLPLINACYFRFEAFGDLNNDIQLINYINICKKNPDVNFALWTKNLHILKQVFDTRFNNNRSKKPKNLVIVYSSLFVNKPTPIAMLPWYVDRTFTVYDKEFIEQNGIEINCGARCCLTCHKCYKKTGPKEMREELKKGSTKRKENK
jgi:hypothetical protein